MTSCRPRIVKYRKSDGSWTSKTAASSPLSLTSLTAGATYEVTVAAKNSAGTGPESATVTFAPLAAATPAPTTPPAATPTLAKPGAPAKVTGSAKGKGNKRVLAVKWSAPTTGGAATSYSVQRSMDKKKWRTLTSSTLAAKWKSKKGTTVYVRVQAINAAGPGPYSTIVKFKG